MDGENILAIGADSSTAIPAETLEIRDLETLKVMADSLRMQLVDLLRRDAATVKELAAAIGTSPKSLYYHVNLLEKHGLIRVVETRVVSGIVEKRYRATAHLFHFTELGSDGDTSPVQKGVEAVRSLLTITADEIRVGLEGGAIIPEVDAPPDVRLNLEWDLLDLSPQAADELARRMEALVEEYRQGEPFAGAVHPYRVLLALYPTYRRGERPDVPSLPPAPGGEE